MQRILIVVAVALLAVVAVSGAGTDPAGESLPEGKVHTVATSHLDTQWRWTIRTTIAEYLRATLDDNFALLERYPDYVFNFEGAFRYQLMQEYYPERFERVREYVRQGRWRVCGSWLDAVDVNMPSVESLFRHALYGNGWFDRELGVRSVDVFLPDCFGFGHALPSIMAHSGLTGFSTQKLSWGSAYGTPFDIGRWRGVDGSEVIAAVNPGAYVRDLEGDVSRDSTVAAAVARTVAAGGPPVAYIYHGTGDTGGAPSEASVQRLAESIASDGPLEVIAAGADQLYRELTPDQVASLPVYDGELVMTSHGVGCYTSQAAMKRWNRRCETLADAAERAATLAWWLGAGDYPHATLERAWTRFLWHGFHDDLTGTSIPEAYAYSWNDMLLSQQEFAQVLRGSLEAVVAQMDTEMEGMGHPLVLFNPLGHARTEVVTVAGSVPSPFSTGADIAVRVFDPDGREVPTLRWASDPDRRVAKHDRLAFTATVPASGLAVYELRADLGEFYQGPGAPAGWDPATGILETTRYRLRLTEAGLVSLVDKETGRELLAAPPRLQLLHDTPRSWPAWEIDFDDLMAAPYAEVPLGGVPETVVAGPDLARLTFTHEAAGSTFRQTLTVANDRLDWTLDINWATRATLLKAAFFTTARDTAVTYDLGLGTIRRGINRPRLYEVPAQRWADLTDASGAFGLTLMNDGRHGWDHPDAGTLRLTLIHTPAVNDGWRWVDDEKSQDLGRHRVTIGMLGHGPDWRTEAVRAADALNQPILAFRGLDRTPGPWGRRLSLLQLHDGDGADHPGVAVRAVKKSEQGDWMVVRLQELTGAAQADVTMAPIAPATAFRELQADEVVIPAGGDAHLRAGALRCDLAAYQPRTFALALTPPDAAGPVTRRRSEPLDLPWNVDGLAPHDDPTDGDLDGAGTTLPSEQVPASFVRDGVRFVTGPRERGAANLLRCAGQTLDLPDTDLEWVRLLICAVDGSRRAHFDVGPVMGTRWIPAGREFFGQWDSRLVGEDVVHEASDLVPGFVRRENVGWVFTHHHDEVGDDVPYAFTHFYAIDLRLAGAGITRAEALPLPDDPSLVILAASLMDRPGWLVPASELVDRPRRPSVAFAAPRRAFVDSVAVALTTPHGNARLTVARDGGTAVPYDGAPLVLTESTTLAATVDAGFPETTTRTATFTRLEPWPAADATASTAAGLAVRGYRGAWEALPDWSQLAPTLSATSATVAIPPALPEEDIGAVFEGWLEAPARGVYRFWLTSDDGSRLVIDDHVVVDHDGLHGASAVWGDAPLAAGRHRIRVEYFQHLGGRDLKLEWSGPGLARQPVPASALSH